MPGWLRDEDVLKLYELAYLTPGPILEIGSYQGKSSVVLASALGAGAASRDRSISVDIDPDALASAGRTDSRPGPGRPGELRPGDVARSDAGRSPAFRPRSCSWTATTRRPGCGGTWRCSNRRVPDGGLLLFHDYLDDRNADPEEKHMGVVQGVAESWVAGDCDFAGVFGCCALFRRRTGGLGPPAPADLSHLAARAEDGLPPLIDLTARDDLRMRYLQRVRRPLGAGCDGGSAASGRSRPAGSASGRRAARECRGTRRPRPHGRPARTSIRRWRRRRTARPPRRPPPRPE